MMCEKGDFFGIFRQKKGSCLMTRNMKNPERSLSSNVGIPLQK
jgi:hypothetical protein